MKTRFVFPRFSITFLLVLFSAGALILPHAGYAQQGQTSMGTDFWLGFMPNGSGAGNTNVWEQLFIASSTNNKVTIDIPGKGSHSITLTAGSVQDYDVTGQMTFNSDTATTNAIHVTSTNPITVYGYSAWGNSAGIGDSPDGFLALPLPACGTKYYTVNFPDNGVFSSGQATFIPGEFLITSPYDDNVITINTAADTKGGHRQGAPWSVTLMKGQTYLVQSAGTAWGENDLTGSLITSTKPISVLTGHQISSVPTEECCSADNLFEMVPSVDKWGTQYFDMPMSGKTVVGDYLRVLSAENGNEITYAGNVSGQHGPIFLNAGEYFDIPLQTDALVFTSVNHKKFIVAQYAYSQGYGGDPGLSDPFMVLFTPQEQFEKEMIFRTPSSRRGLFVNYVTFISRWDSITKIQINGQPITSYTSVGQAIFPGTNPRMAAYRIILGPQAKNYIATLGTPFGAYQYGFSNYEGYGWPAGMAQGILATGDTLPPLAQTLGSSCGNYNLRFTEPRLKSNGFSFNDTRIASVSMITDSGDVRWPTPSYNYTFTPDSNFIPGDSVMTATLSVIDPTKDAYAAIDAVDLAGNDTVYQYFYFAPHLILVPPAPFEFGNVLVGSDSCKRIMLIDTSTGPLELSDVSLANFGLFTISPTVINRTLAPGDSVQLQLCFTASDTLHSFDSLIVNTGCVSLHYPLSGHGVTPIIIAGDLDFGYVPVGDTVCQPLVIRNTGDASLIIYPNSLLLDTIDFSFPDSNQLPDTIPAGSSITIEFCFHPHASGPAQTLITWPTNLTGVYAHQRKDTSLLSGNGTASGVNSTPASIPLALFISPNPTSGSTLISLSGAPSANVEIFDVLGRHVASFRVTGSYEWWTGGLPAGTYIVRAAAHGEVVSKRVVKQ